MMRRFQFLWVIVWCLTSCQAQNAENESILPGAYQLGDYLPDIQGKKVALFVNHTSMIGPVHLVDTLLGHEVNITKVFTPEHGFRGTAPDGESIDEVQDNYPFEMISLYTSNTKKPGKEQMENIDVLVIDIQDVGVRFYTYASTMTYLMEACARENIRVILLDRPNPNGSYVDGPVLEQAFQSFTGLHPIPLVHGLTLGEMAMMINDEGWLGHGIYCPLTIITVRNWNHQKPYSLSVKPSPNLPNDLSIALYPSLGLFEGTGVSVGRGTDFPFQVIGHPQFPEKTFSFVPRPNAGSKDPLQQDKECFGVSLVGDSVSYQFTLKYLIRFYQAIGDQPGDPFFNGYFKYLAGNNTLQKQIASGMSEAEIRQTWQADLEAYKKIRKKYLLYGE